MKTLTIIFLAGFAAILGWLDLTHKVITGTYSPEQHIATQADLLVLLAFPSSLAIIFWAGSPSPLKTKGLVAAGILGTSAVAYTLFWVLAEACLYGK